MASRLAAATKGKRKAQDAELDGGDTSINGASVRRNKQRVLVLPSRGVTSQMRHLINDIESLLPHAKKGEIRT